MTQNDLRQMVRDVLREVVASRGQVAANAPANAPAMEAVRIASDTDLMGFAARVIAAQTAVTSGALRFTLAGGPAPVANPAPATGGAALTGVITETTINRHASAGRLLLAPGAVVTPLARDRARQLNLKLERSR